MVVKDKKKSTKETASSKVVHNHPTEFVETIVNIEHLRKRRLIEACRQNPVFFLTNFVKVKPKKGGRAVKLVLKEGQKVVLRALMKHFYKPYAMVKGEVLNRLQQVRLIVLKYRQVGLSTLIAALILHEMLFFQGTEASIFLHKDEYSQDMLKRVKYLYKQLPRFLKPKRTRSDKSSAGKFSFQKLESFLNVGTPGKSKQLAGDKGRSQTLDVVLISELPRYPYAQDFLQGVVGAVKQGNIYVESTPLIKGDVFHSTYEKGKADTDYSEWVSIFLPWVMEAEYTKPLRPGEEKQILENLTEDEAKLFEKYPHLMTAGKIKWRRITISDDFGGDVRRFKQEYPEDDESCFGAAGAMYFDDPEFDIKQITVSDEHLNVGRPAIPGHFHMIGVDVAKGLGGDADASCIEVIDYDTQEQVYELADNKLSDKLLPQKIYEVWKQYPGVIGVEVNSIGTGVMATIRSSEQFLKDEAFQNSFYFKNSTHDGFYTDQRNKPQILAELYTALKEAVLAYIVQKDSHDQEAVFGLRIFSEKLQYELSFMQDKGGKIEAVTGTGLHDDRVMAIAICWYLRKFAPQYRLIYERYVSNEKA